VPRLSGQPASSGSPGPPAELQSRKEAAQTPTGTLQIGVRPWAEVSVDGNLVGTSPIRPLDLEAGAHTLGFVHPDYLPVERQVTIRAGERTKLLVDLEAVGVPR
jgi:hypothetical protein